MDKRKVFAGVAIGAGVLLAVHLARAHTAPAGGAKPLPSPIPQPPIAQPPQQPIAQPVNPFEIPVDLTPAEQALKDWVADPNAQNQVQKGGNIGEEEEAPFMTAGLSYASIFAAA